MVFFNWSILDITIIYRNQQLPNFQQGLVISVDITIYCFKLKSSLYDPHRLIIKQFSWISLRWTMFSLVITLVLKAVTTLLRTQSIHWSDWLREGGWQWADSHDPPFESFSSFWAGCQRAWRGRKMTNIVNLSYKIHKKMYGYSWAASDDTLLSNEWCLDHAQCWVQAFR